MRAVLCFQVADIDFFDSHPFPSCDVISMGMILHDWGIDKKRMLMQKVGTEAKCCWFIGGASAALQSHLHWQWCIACCRGLLP
jgi:hypothetical protein